MSNKIAESIKEIGILIKDSKIGKFNIHIKLSDIFPCLSDREQKQHLLQEVEDKVKRKLNPFDYHGNLIILKKNLYEYLVKHPDVRKEAITDPDYNIFDIFNYKDGAYRRLLIVGKPGSGKTTTLYSGSRSYEVQLQR